MTNVGALTSIVPLKLVLGVGFGEIILTLSLNHVLCYWHFYSFASAPSIDSRGCLLGFIRHGTFMLGEFGRELWLVRPAAHFVLRFDISSGQQCS